MSNSLQIELFSDGPPNDTIFVLGATRCGKTALIGNLVRTHPRIVVFDTKDEYPPEFFGKGAVIVRTVSDFIGAMNKGTPIIIIRLENEWQDPNRYLNDICYRIMEFQRANKKNLPSLTFCMDELNRYVNPSGCPGGLRDIIMRGGGLNIRKIFGGQWFNHIPPFIRDSFSEIYTFRHNDERGLMMLARFGFDARTVQNLPPHTVCHLSGGVVKQLKLVATNNKER